MRTLCHRGLDIDQNTVESSLKSFEQVLTSCDGLELDIQRSKDGRLFVWHDQRADRLSAGQLTGPLTNYNFSKISSKAQMVSQVCTWEDVVKLIRTHSTKLFALHLKGANQNKTFLKTFEEALDGIVDLHTSLMIFDCRREVAHDFSQKFPKLPLGLSVAHSFDIARYNSVTEGTLYTIQECIESADIIQWAWLDEWDLRDSNGSKKLYSSETVSALKNQGLQVAVVSPELHAISPGLLGGEVHEEGKDLHKLEQRWREFMEMGVDAICSDYCSRIANMTSSSF